MENLRNQQGEMVDDQINSEKDSQTLEERKRKKNHQFWNSRITVLVLLVLLL
jgi:predicted nucleic acid-binding Zn ribbon protein